MNTRDEQEPSKAQKTYLTLAELESEYAAGLDDTWSRVRNHVLLERERGLCVIKESLGNYPCPGVLCNDFDSARASRLYMAAMFNRAKADLSLVDLKEVHVDWHFPDGGRLIFEFCDSRDDTTAKYLRIVEQLTQTAKKSASTIDWFRLDSVAGVVFITTYLDGIGQEAGVRNLRILSYVDKEILVAWDSDKPRFPPESEWDA